MKIWKLREYIINASAVVLASEMDAYGPETARTARYYRGLCSLIRKLKARLPLANHVLRNGTLIYENEKRAVNSSLKRRADAELEKMVEAIQNYEDTYFEELVRTV